MKERIINKLVARGVVEGGENTREFLSTLRTVKLCGPLVKMDYATGNYSYRQLCIKYDLSIMQVRNILGK